MKFRFTNSNVSIYAIPTRRNNVNKLGINTINRINPYIRNKIKRNYTDTFTINNFGIRSIELDNKNNNDFLNFINNNKINDKIIKNPLVIGICISNYNGNNNLDGPKKDKTNLKKLCQIYNYQYHDIKNDYITKNDFLSFLDFIQNILKNNKENYDSFIMFFSGHGNKNCIYTSDIESCQIIDIKQKFCGEILNNFINNPKIFIFDSCRGNNIINPIKKDNYGITKSLNHPYENFLEIYGNPLNYVSLDTQDNGGLLIDTICYILTNTIENNNNILNKYNFNDLIIFMTHYLLNISNKKMIIEINSTLTYNIKCFEKCNNNNGNKTRSFSVNHDIAKIFNQCGIKNGNILKIDKIINLIKKTMENNNKNGNMKGLMSENYCISQMNEILIDNKKENFNTLYWALLGYLTYNKRICDNEKQDIDNTNYGNKEDYENEEKEEKEEEEKHYDTKSLFTYIMKLALPIISDKIPLKFRGEIKKDEASANINDGNSVQVFPKDIKPEQREDVQNSCLLAQLSSNKKYINIETNPKEWSKFYFTVLEHCGWTMQKSEWKELNINSKDFSLDAKIIELITNIIKNPSIVNIVKSTLNSLKK